MLDENPGVRKRSSEAQRGTGTFPVKEHRYRFATWRALVLMMCAVAVVLTGANAINYSALPERQRGPETPG